jgi:hypothetical protein
MLFIGKGDFDAAHMTEARSHMALWAMVNAPLFIGMDLSTATPEQIALFGNVNLVALNQDRRATRPCWPMIPTMCRCWSRRWPMGTRPWPCSTCTASPTKASVTAAHLKFAPDAPIATTNLWDNTKGSFTGELKLDPAAHETVFR